MAKNFLNNTVRTKSSLFTGHIWPDDQFSDSGQEKCPVSLLQPLEDRVGAWHVASPSEQTPLRMPPTAHTPSLPVTLLPVAEVDRAGESREDSWREHELLLSWKKLQCSKDPKSLLVLQKGLHGAYSSLLRGQHRGSGLAAAFLGSLLAFYFPFSPPLICLAPHYTLKGGVAHGLSLALKSDSVWTLYLLAH